MFTQNYYYYFFLEFWVYILQFCLFSCHGRKKIAIFHNLTISISQLLQLWVYISQFRFFFLQNSRKCQYIVCSLVRLYLSITELNIMPPFISNQCRNPDVRNYHSITRVLYWKDNSKIVPFWIQQPVIGAIPIKGQLWTLFTTKRFIVIPQGHIVPQCTI